MALGDRPDRNKQIAGAGPCRTSQRDRNRGRGKFRPMAGRLPAALVHWCKAGLRGLDLSRPARSRTAVIAHKVCSRAGRHGFAPPQWLVDAQPLPSPAVPPDWVFLKGSPRLQRRHGRPDRPGSTGLAVRRSRRTVSPYHRAAISLTAVPGREGCPLRWSVPGPARQSARQVDTPPSAAPGP